MGVVKRRFRWRGLLFLLPTAGVLLTPLVFRAEPRLLGLPFYWWYLLAWAPVTAVLIALVVAGIRDEPDEDEPEPPPDWWLNWERDS